jgi:hypothetical protein
MRNTPILAFAALLFATGCHSAFIDATLRNTTNHPITLVELDYPSASFGTQTLAPNQDFHYRFKVLGDGNLKLLYTNPGNQDQKAPGPHLNEGDEGTLLVTVTPTGVQWTPNLHHR